MPSDWLRLVALGAVLVAVQQCAAAPTLDQEATNKKIAGEQQQSTRPKVKRSQEVLMFGNQQNRPSQQATEIKNAHTAAAAAASSPTAEKRTLSNSGLDDAVETAEQQLQQQRSQQQQQQQQQQQLQQQIAAAEDNQPKALPAIAGYVMEPLQQQQQQQRDRTYEYGKVLVNELGGGWDLPPAYGRYYALGDDEERRKRSNNDAAAAAASTPTTSSTASPVIHAQPQHLAAPENNNNQAVMIMGQPKRSGAASLASYYQDSRYKRESDFDPEDFLALLSLYDNERRNRRNWRNYDSSDDYDNVAGTDDESNLIGLDDEDPRGSSWLDQQLAYPQQQQQQQQQQSSSRHYLSSSDPILASELAALSRSRPGGYYEQYLAQQYGNNQYDTGAQSYGTPQYGLPAYVQQRAYYPPEKRFMVSRKRSQNYDAYGGRSGLLMNSRGYPTYNQHRLLY